MLPWCCPLPGSPGASSLGYPSWAQAAPTTSKQHRDGQGCTGMLCSVWQLPEDGKPALQFIIHANNPVGGRRGLPTNKGAIFSWQPMECQSRI